MEAALARVQQVGTLRMPLSNLAVVQADRNNWQSAVVANVPQRCGREPKPDTKILPHVSGTALKRSGTAGWRS